MGNGKSALIDYIKKNWKYTIKFNPNDEGTFIGLPYPYTTPSKEVSFWEKNRKSSNCLNCYGADLDESVSNLATVKSYIKRTGIIPKGSEFECAINAVAEAESGWDYNPRFYGKCHEYNPVCLNSLLWFDEQYLGELERKLNLGDGQKWFDKAEHRKKFMLDCMQDDKGVFYDYSYVEDKISDIISVGSFYPYFVGMLKCDKKVAEELIKELELPYGVQSTSANYEAGTY